MVRDVLCVCAGGAIVNFFQEPGACVEGVRQGDGAYPRWKHEGSGGERDARLFLSADNDCASPVHHAQ